MAPDAPGTCGTCHDLWNIEEIRQLKARYFRALDTKDYALLGRIVAKHAVFGRDDQQVAGREKIVEYLRRRGETARTVHHGHCPEIAIDPADRGRATGIWAMEDYLVENPGEPELRGFHGYGHYHETYVFEDGAWQLETLLLTRIRIDPLPGGLPEIYRRAGQPGRTAQQSRSRS
jgi:hypothetical protein